MKNTDKTIVIVVDIADTDALKKALGDSESPDIFPQRVVRPVANGLQRLCSENRATLSNKVNPFVVEAVDPKDVLNIVRALISPNEGGFRVTIPGSTDPVQFYIGISCRSQNNDDDELRSVAHARALAGGAGPNEIKIENEVAELLVNVEMDDLVILFQGRHKLLDENIPRRIYQLRPHLDLKSTGEEKGEIVRLTLAVIDILHSTNLKPLMGSTQEERLKNYDREILKPFRTFTADVAKRHGGAVVDQTGDSCFLSFPDPDQARQWAVAILEEDCRIPAPDGYEWPEVRYHLSIDSGRVMRNSKGLLQGNFVDRVHRLNDLSQDNQIILSPSVATALQEELLDEGADGRVHRHEAVSLQGIVEDVEVWEYCPPGIEPRQPRKGKGQTQLKPAALAAVSGSDSLEPFARDIERLADRLNGKEARVASKFKDNTRIFAFDRVLDGVRFLIDIRRVSKEQLRGALHYGLVIEKSDGLLDGSSTADTVALLPATDQPGTIRMSGSAATHVSDRNNRRFRIRHIEGASVKLRDQVESVYELISKMPLTLQYLRTVAAILVVAILGEFLYSQFVRSPRQKDHALFVSLSPALDGQSWWFDISPWFTPEIRRQLYRNRGDGVGLKRLKDSMLKSGQAFQFYEDLENYLPNQENSISSTLHSRMSEWPMDRDACWGIIETILKDQSGDEIEATEWHLVANLLTSLNPSRKDNDDPEFASDNRAVLEKFGNAQNGKRQNDYLRALFAFEKADRAYQETRLRKERDVLIGLQALCAADKAWLYYSRREMKDCEKFLDRAVAKIEEVKNENLLKVFILSLRGETKVRLYSRNNTTDSVSTNENPDVDFDEAMKNLAACFSTAGGRNINPQDHLFAAAINQRKAHFYLETWQLGKSEKSAEEANEIREKWNGVKFAESPESGWASAPLDRKVNLERVLCLFLKALAAQFSGNAHNAESALRTLIETSSTPEGQAFLGPELKDHLSNLHQRFADYHIFVSGDLEKAREQLEESTQNAKDSGWDNPNHRYHKHYIEQMCRSAWLMAIKGERDQCRNVLEDLQKSSLGDRKTEEPLYFKVALAFADDNPDSKLKNLVEEKKDDNSITRDERQLLFLVCEYLRSGELTPHERNEIDRAYGKFSEPWSKDGGIGSNAYLDAIRNCAAAIRRIPAKTPESGQSATALLNPERQPN